MVVRGLFTCRDCHESGAFVGNNPYSCPDVLTASPSGSMMSQSVGGLQSEYPSLAMTPAALQVRCTPNPGQLSGEEKWSHLSTRRAS
jgi:hypothetical protein